VVEPERQRAVPYTGWGARTTPVEIPDLPEFLRRAA
jgi:hypothetical protein